LPDFSRLTGFESEMLQLLRFLDRQNVENVVFVTTDVHFAMLLRYAFDFDGDGDALTFHELIAGPLSAYRTPTPAQLDPTLRPTLLFGRGGFDNFLHVRITPQADGGSTFQAEIRDAQGVVQDGSELELKAKPRPRP
jgi:alkaline phosphatase D